MFNKKSCSKCGKGIKDSFDFCPYCGNRLNVDGDDLGMLGKNDIFDENSFGNMKMPFGFNNIFSSMLNNLNNLDKQMKISINFGGKPQTFNFDPSEEDKKKKKKEDIKNFFFNNLSSGNMKKFPKLPKEEPKTNMKRIGNKIIYEIGLPGVKSVKDISVMNLENSIELKAVSDKKSYIKLIPVNFPITDYNLSKGKFTLELDAETNQML